MNIHFLCTEDYMTRERAGLKKALDTHCSLSFLDCFPNTAEGVKSSFDGESWPDLAIAPDIHKTYLPEGVEELPFPTACFHIDAYSATGNRSNMSRLFDLVLVFHPYSIKDYSRSHPDVRSFPHAIPREAYQNNFRSKVYDVSMIGRLDGKDYKYRRAVVNSLSSMDLSTNEMRCYYPYHKMIETYSKSKITVNVSRGKHLDLAHLSCIEIMGSGTLLLTTSDPDKNRPHELTKLGFEKDKHFDTFGSIEEMRQKIRRYLNQDKQRKEIAEASRAKVLADHTCSQRAACLTNWVQEGIHLQAPARSMKEGEVASIYVDYFSKRGHIDKTLQHLRRQRKAGGSGGRSLFRSTAKAAKATIRGWQRALTS